jgi:GMP synthase-like glutamine amidotransferase
MSGLIGHWAEEGGHTVTPFAAYESIFPGVEDFDALVVMGAPLSVRDLAEDAGIAVALETNASSLGLQSHLEVDGAEMENMVWAFAGEVSAGDPGVMSPADMEFGLQKWGYSCRQYLFAILDRWEK